MAPLAVLPAVQRQGVGARLIEKAIQWSAQSGANRLFVYGDPNYYGRFGFKPEAASQFFPSYILAYPFGWQAIVLKEEPQPIVTANLLCVPALCHPTLW